MEYGRRPAGQIDASGLPGPPPERHHELRDSRAVYRRSHAIARSKLTRRRMSALYGECAASA